MDHALAMKVIAFASSYDSASLVETNASPVLQCSCSLPRVAVCFNLIASICSHRVLIDAQTRITLDGHVIVSVHTAEHELDSSWRNSKEWCSSRCADCVFIAMVDMQQVQQQSDSG